MIFFAITNRPEYFVCVKYRLRSILGPLEDGHRPIVVALRSSVCLLVSQQFTYKPTTTVLIGFFLNFEHMFSGLVLTERELFGFFDVRNFREFLK